MHTVYEPDSRNHFEVGAGLSTFRPITHLLYEKRQDIGPMKHDNMIWTNELENEKLVKKQKKIAET